MWNLWHGHKSPRQQHGNDNPYRCPNHLPEPLVQSTQQSELQPNDLTLERPPGSVLLVCHPISSVPLHTSHSCALKRNISILVAMMIYLLLAQQSSNTGSATQYVTSLATQQRTNPWLRKVPVVKSWKLCSCQTRAIIQHLWDTAWDLITQQNVESCLSGSGLPTIHNQGDCKSLSTSHAQNSLS